MELIDLPPEDIEEICEHLDPLSLRELARTSNDMYNICIRTLKERKKTHYPSKLVGTWLSCGFNRKIPSINWMEIITITLDRDTLDIVQRDSIYKKPLLDNMKKKSFNLIRKVSLDDIDSLEKLYRNLQDQNFIRINTNDIYMYVSSEDSYLYNYPLESGGVIPYKKLDNMTDSEKIYVLKYLGAPTTGDTLDNLIYNALKDRNLVVECI